MISIGGRELKFREGYLYVLFAFLIARSVNLYGFIPSKFDSLVFAVLVVFGVVFMLKDFGVSVIKNHNYPYSWMLTIFLAIAGVSSLVNHKYGLVANVKIIMWTALYMFLIYELARRRIFGEKFYDRLCAMLIGAWFCLSAVSMWMFVTQFSYNKWYSIRDRVRIGFLENRLFGVFDEPNYGATTCLIVIIISVYFLLKHLNKVVTAFLWINIVLQYVVIILTGSRTAILLGVIVVFVACFMLLLTSKQLSGINIWLRILFALVGAVVLTVAVYGVVTVTKHLLQKLPAIFAHVDHEPKDADKKVTLVRQDVADNADVSNQRFAIWNSAFQLFKSKWLLGTSPHGVIPYAKDAFPKGFIATQGIVTHNSYINILTSTGILGIIPSMAFYIQKAFIVARDLFMDPKFFKSYKGIYFLVILVTVLFGMFNNQMIFVNNVGSFMFWLFFGRLVGDIEYDTRDAHRDALPMRIF